MTNDSGIIPIGLLNGKVVFITGASRGIGAAAARLFAREGAAVVLAARSADALDRVVAEVRADGGIADAVALDLADRASIRAAVDRVEKLHGRLDGAFNNGAAIQQPGPLDTTSDEDVDEQFAVNFRAHWTAMTAEAALMRRDGGGAIVNTSSIGSRRANSELPAYGAMKARSDHPAEIQRLASRRGNDRRRCPFWAYLGRRRAAGSLAATWAATASGPGRA